MRSIVLPLAVLLAWSWNRVEAREPAPPAPESLAARLDDTDAFVRDAAAEGLVAHSEKALDVLVKAEQGGPPVKAALARRIRLAIAAAKRLAAAPQTEVAFWMDLEETLAIEPEAVRDAALRLAFEKEWTIEEVRGRRDAGRRAAVEFCARWTDNGGFPFQPSDTEAVASNRRQEQSLQQVGAAAAPYLLWVLSKESSPSFRVSARGPRAGRDFVIAMHAVRLLKLRAAVPFLLPWVNGQSAWAHGVAVQVLQDLTGQDFGLDFSPESQQRAFSWWREQRSAHTSSTGWLLRMWLREIHEVLAAQAVGTAHPSGDFVKLVGTSFEEMRAQRLKAIVGDDLPLAFQGDIAQRLSAVRTAETWAEDRYAR